MTRPETAQLPDPTDAVEICLLVRRRREIPDHLVTGTGTITRDELGREYGADPTDLARVRDELGRLGLDVVNEDAATRRVVVRGTPAVLADVFGTQPGQPGEPRIPVELRDVVRSVLGMDPRALAVPMFRAVPAQPRIIYTPPEVGKVYAFPEGADGTGRTVAIVSATGGYRRQDMDAYFAQLGLPSPTLVEVGVAGAENSPAPDGAPPTTADIEALLDVQVAGALVPGARIVSYFVPNSDAGVVEGVRTALHATPTPTVLSLSWGASEGDCSSHFVAGMDDLFVEAAALGVTVVAASGNAGSGNDENDGGSHVNYPASSPYVLAVGGTTLIADPETHAIISEEAWNGGAGAVTGGGVSRLFPMPEWQATADVPNRYGSDERGRGVPDVAANADSMTGYQIFMQGKVGFVGGTSAATPLWAALVCRLAQELGRPLGLLQPLLYRDLAPDRVTAGFRDVVAGNNGAYAAAPGWDPNSGLGSPDGSALLQVLRDQA